MDLVPIRAEVIEARRNRRAGAIVLARPVPMKVAAGVGAAVVIALALLLGLGEYTSKERVSGQLLPADGAIKVVAPQFGRISARRVRQGDTVLAGQPLFDLSAERMGEHGSLDARIGAQLDERRAQATARLDAALAQLAQQRATLEAQRRLNETEVTGHQGAIAIQNELLGSARDNYRRYASLARKGFIAPAQLAQYRNAFNVERAKAAALALNLAGARRAMTQLQGELDSLDGQASIARAEARASLAALQQETVEHEGRSATVTAPAAGIVTAFAYTVGQSVQAGTVLATVLPAGSALEAQLLVPSRAKASIERGQLVQLRIDAFPYQKYGLVAGTVRQVDQSPATDGAPGSAPQYRVSVALATDSMIMYGKRKPFEPGMTLEADIFNDRRRLIEWVFDPLVSVAHGRAR